MSWLRIIRFFKRFTLVVGTGVIVFITISYCSYLRTQWYSFPEIQKFSGDVFYNPYAGQKSFGGVISNFHAHSATMGGITGGIGSSDEVYSAYEQLGYGLFSLSNYHEIESREGLKAYEHGWGIFKTHQVIVGADEVTWFDFPLVQNEHQKQTVLERVGELNPRAFIALAHPSLRKAYSTEEIVRLQGVHGFEAVNKLKKSLLLWDEVLSRGKYLTILGSDDTHNYLDPTDIGRCGTFVLGRSIKEDAIVAALKAGKTFAVEFGGPVVGDFSEKSEYIKKPLLLKQVEVFNDTLSIRFKQPISFLTIIGDHSDTLYYSEHTDGVDFRINDSLTYVRFEYNTPWGSKVYSNPIVRTADGKKPITEGVVRDELKSSLYRFLLLLPPTVIMLLLIRKLYGRSTKKTGSNSGNRVLPLPRVLGRSGSGGLLPRAR